jgi:hypothetical protein
MTFRLSTGLRNAMAGSLGAGRALNRGIIKAFTGSQPVSADAAETGTHLITFSAASGAVTRETRATGTIVITGASGGSINDITVGGLSIIPDGAVPAVAGDTAATAAALAEAINRNGVFEASVSGSTVTIKAPPGSGATHNAETLTGSLTTVTATYGGGSVSGGVAAVNGLILLNPMSGILQKSSQVWSGLGLAAGTIGWFRHYSSDATDTGGLVSGAPWHSRLDGSCGVGSGDMSLSSLAVSVGNPITVDRFELTMPAS